MKQCNEFIWRYLVTSCDIFGACGKRLRVFDVEALKWHSFLTNSQKPFYILIKSMESCWRYWIVTLYHRRFQYSVLMHDSYIVHRSILTTLYRLNVCVKWLLTPIFVQKGLLFHYLDINFDATFTTSSQDTIVCKYLQTGSVLLSHL